MSSSTSTTQTVTTVVNGHHLYRLTNKILDAHSSHFITISLLFLPFTFSASTAVQFYYSSSSATYPFNLFLIKTIFASSHNLLTFKTLTTLLAVVLPAVAGVALTTYTANQAIHRKPLAFSSALKSLTNSYIPLLHTVTVGSITLIIIFLAFTLSPIAVIGAIIEVIKALGFDFDLLILSALVNSIASCALAYAISKLVVIWGSAAAITVLESKSGFEALRQSANQSKEFRGQSV
ncbi:hypothetical protein SSX86_017496 [Deinandra increscens subsp. villosa]|uniref:Uncharacterized protein n=1 Tax=Deinandra increscens subsp. villosa TaxID=3103831 RepID=A0AAP0CV76_9ASTR